MMTKQEKTVSKSDPLAALRGGLAGLAAIFVVGVVVPYLLSGVLGAKDLFIPFALLHLGMVILGLVMLLVVVSYTWWKND